LYPQEVFRFWLSLTFDLKSYFCNFG